jgi:hypothetical protein
VVIVVSLIFKMAYFLQELLKKARVRCAIANSKIFAKIFISDTRAVASMYSWGGGGGGG